MVLSMLFVLLGCLPAFHTAITTGSYLTFIDYASMTLGFSIGGLILELEKAHGNN